MKRIFSCTVILLGLLASNPTTPALGQQAALTAEHPLPANSYEVRILEFYRQQMLDAFPVDDYPEEYAEKAKQIIEEFCRLKHMSWVSMYQRPQAEPMPDLERRILCQNFVDSTEDHEPLSYLLALWMLNDANNKPLHGAADPDLVLDAANDLMVSDYTPFVQCVGYAFSRHCLILSTRFGGARDPEVRQKRLDESMVQHRRLLDVVTLAMLDGVGDNVDEEMLFHEINHLIEWDYFWNRELIPVSLVEFGFAVSLIDPADTVHPWTTRMLQAQYHRDCFISIRNRQVQVDSQGKYMELTMREHYEKAQALIDQAWEEHPDRPLAILSAVMLHGSDPMKAAVWYQRGLDPNIPTVHTLYRYHRERVSPVRTGSVQGSLDYIADIVTNERYGGIILAEQVMWASNDLREDTRGLDFIKSPGFYESIATLCEKMIEADYDSLSDGNWYQLWAITAMLAGKTDEANAIYQAHGRSFEGALEYMFYNVNSRDILSRFDPLPAGD